MPGTVVTDPEIQVAGAVDRELDDDGGRRVLQRVLHEVRDDLREPIGVRVGRERRRALDLQRDVQLHRRGPERVDRGAHGVGRVDRARRERELAGVEPGEVQQVGDEALEPAGLGRDHVRGAGLLVVGADGAVDHRLGPAADRRERRAEVVGDAEHERALHALRVLEPRGHRVEGAGEVGQLVFGVTTEIHPRGEVAGRDRASGVAHGLERPGQPPREVDGDDDGQREGNERGDEEEAAGLPGRVVVDRPG